MLITARGRHAEVDNRGVIGHAVSHDLAEWTVEEPYTPENSGFAQLEVPQIVQIDERWALVFSCFPGELAATHRSDVTSCGMWAAAIDSPTGPCDLSRAAPITDDELYAGKIVTTRDGSAVLLAFRTGRPDGEFIGGICDPLPVAWHGDRLRIITKRA
jgi:beta-fructofuranosidase